MLLICFAAEEGCCQKCWPAKNLAQEKRSKIKNWKRNESEKNVAQGFFFARILDENITAALELYPNKCNYNRFS